jgi:hypothetical protein
MPASHTPTSHVDPSSATSVPAHCPAGLNMADPSVRALCSPGAGSPGAGTPDAGNAGPSPTPDASAPIVPVSTPTASSVPPDLVERVRAFLASDPSPEQIEQLATQLEGAGLSDAARQLREVAASRRREGRPEVVPSRPAAAGPSSPAGTPGPSSSSATDSVSSPRLDGSGAPLSGRQLAAQTADALRARLTEIRRLTQAFQDAASIETDGQYGPVTRAALTYWSGRSAPRPWVGSGSPRYRGMRSVSRGDGSPAAQHAERTAGALFRALLEPEGDAKPAVERLQRAIGLTVDGKYGRQTRAALMRLGVVNPPQAFRRTRRRSSSPRRSG